MADDVGGSFPEEKEAAPKTREISPPAASPIGDPATGVVYELIDGRPRRRELPSTRVYVAFLVQLLARPGRVAQVRQPGRTAKVLRGRFASWIAHNKDRLPPGARVRFKLCGDAVRVWIEGAP